MPPHLPQSPESVATPSQATSQDASLRWSDALYSAKKYWDYFFETDGFGPSRLPGQMSAHVLEAARQARGASRAPGIFVHGIMPRSGTVYLGELLRLHPHLVRHPHQLWEFPALQLTRDLHRLQAKFLRLYKINRSRVQTDDFLALFGAAMMAWLHEAVPEDKRVLVKMPSVQFLDYFPAMFPHESLLILVRDGRDLVHSTLRTWRYLSFIQVCLRWNRSARMILDVCNGRWTGPRRPWLAKYEYALFEPEAFVREACAQFGLDPDVYPYEKIKFIRVVGSSKLAQRPNFKWTYQRRPENFRPVEYWRSWSPLRKLLFKAIAGASLIELGYCQDHTW
jgi:protein-tyrosine sulfotransferase